ncbi:MAG: flavin reductase family protein [Candidatus Bathyarchaeia archaeon]|nr:flavin reductase [Candidatus Bathyarchaeota archaeon]
MERIGLDVQTVLDKILNGVTVVTSKAGSKINGLTIAWATQVSFQPPIVAVSVGKTRYTHDMIQSSRIFAVNILHEGQVEVARLFGLQSGRDIDKFATIPYETKVTGAPILKDCLAYLDCEVERAIPVGDHTLFAGRIVDANIKADKKPLAYNPDDYW